jgi:hypothetical protein
VTQRIEDLLHFFLQEKRAGCLTFVLGKWVGLLMCRAQRGHHTNIRCSLGFSLSKAVATRRNVNRNC